MRVLMTADALGGVWTYALDLAGGLASAGDEVELAVLGGELGPGERAAADRAGVVRVHDAALALEWMDDPWEDVDASGEWLLDLARRSAPDVVHLNQLAFGALDWGAPVVTVGHSCVRSWWRAVHGEPEPARYAEYARRARAGLRASDVVVAPTRAFLATLERLYGPFREARAIPNGRAPGDRRPRPKEPLVVGVGRLWDEGKNAAALDRVASRLPWKVALAGERRRPGSGCAGRLRSARALGRLEPRALARWLGRASIFAHPARYEPFGLAPLEAAQSGCALVLGDIATLREVWGDAAAYVDPGDDDAIAEGIARVIAEPALRERLARRARDRAAELTAGRMTRRYRALYGSLAGRRAGALAETA